MTRPSIAAIIVGIDGWEQYTLPLIESIRKHEPSCDVITVDNHSDTPYPDYGNVVRTPRLCYSAAINFGKLCLDADEWHRRDITHEFTKDSPSIYDWYIVLSNDVLCTGSFADVLAGHGDDTVVGPLLKEVHGFPYLEGWCMAFSRRAWDAIGGFDERFLGSDYEDVAASTKARQEGFWLVEDLPFKHLDQRQRFYIIDDFAGKNAHNRDLFLREYAGVN